MKHTTGRASLLAGIALIAAACGGSSDNGLASTAETATSTTAAETTTTTAAAETTETTVEETTTTVEETTTTAAPADTGTDPFEGMTDAERAAVLDQMGLTEEQLAQFELLLDTDAGKQIMAQGIVDATSLTNEQALCIVENGDIIGLMVGVTGGLTEPDSELTASFLRTLDTCGIPLSAFEG
ncbi:MAG: hypothetical protein R2710_19870 [Acidimicrobiales bacterium]